MMLNGVEVEDTYCEAFEGIVSRLLVTLRDEQLMQYTAAQCSALPSIVVGRTEAGVERWVRGDETPDNNHGFILQVWGELDPENPEKSLKKFYKELGLRIRQGILVIPTTTVFNYLDSEEKFDLMENVGYCGDVYQNDVELYDRNMIKIPLMMGDWFIERKVGYQMGVSGGNLWFMCDSEKTALKAGKRVLNALYPMKNIITPFAICSAGSKTVYDGQPHPEIGPTTNHSYCPTLREQIEDSKVPEGVTSIPEIVINGLTMEDVRDAMKIAMKEVIKVKGVLKISAGNFGGTLGKHKITLRSLWEEL
ncbi:MAG TPA: formylmethanofuran--tetrahydromethanopterin N-formyltransferase [candidate division Zixibacteria bacterium]|nr:formylmethanofuran--tetrahydromethanopterin N-formyltransferase [candidate division Zixibacteria bacterium]